MRGVRRWSESMIPTMDEAKAILAAHHSLIREVVVEAWGEWRDVQACRVAQGLAAVLYPRTISNYVFDAIARRAILRFATLDKVNVEIEAQTFKLHFAGLTARFKKGGEDKLGSNIHTQAALAFIEADGVLPGLPPETAKVEFIWLPNEIWTDVAQVLVVARDGDNMIWSYEIEPPAASVLVPFEPVPAPESDAPLVTPKPVVRPAAESK